MTLQKTAFNDRHRELGARLVDFAGWEMPLHYGSQLNEHHAVRNDAGIFDVSHMTMTDIEGADAVPYLRRLLANSIDKLTGPGQALYSCLLNEAAGIIDDAVIYRLDGGYRLVSNAATRARVSAWLVQQAAGFAVRLHARTDLVMLAVQGPRALEQLQAGLPAAVRAALAGLRPFSACCLEQDCILARTGYTGEEGLEIMCPVPQGLELWDYCISAGVAPIGLGARDSLRLEAGMHLYGTDMDEAICPDECGLRWTVVDVARDPPFIGGDALARKRADGFAWRQVGLVLLGKGVLRGQQTVLVPDHGPGLVTSGGYAPTLDRSVAIARVPATTPGDATVSVDVRGRPLQACVVQLPFVRKGTVRIRLPKA